MVAGGQRRVQPLADRLGQDRRGEADGVEAEARGRGADRRAQVGQGDDLRRRFP